MKEVESVDGHTHWKWPSVKGDGVRGVQWAVEEESGELRGQEVSSHSTHENVPPLPHISDRTYHFVVRLSVSSLK